MIQIEQTLFGGDTTVAPEERGDCLRACIASIFEYDLIEDVPHFVAEEDWWGALGAWVEDRGFMVGYPSISVDEANPRVLTGYPREGVFWIASVYSPRCKREDGSPGLHAVVMNGKELVWDPHPQREMGHLGFAGHGYWFLAPDPGALFYVPQTREENWFFGDDANGFDPADEVDVAPAEDLDEPVIVEPHVEGMSMLDEVARAENEGLA